MISHATQVLQNSPLATTFKTDADSFKPSPKGPHVTTTLHPAPEDVQELEESTSAAEPQAAAPAPRHTFWAHLRKAGTVAFWAAFAAVMALVVAVVGVPAALSAQGNETHVDTVTTGSMEPTYMRGDLVVVQHLKSLKDYQIGDPVQFYPKSNDPEKVTHRIVAVSLGNGPNAVDGVAGFTTQGDANNVADKPIVAGQVIGKVIYSVPKVGYFILAVRPFLPLVGLGLVAAALLSFLPWGRIFRRKKA